LLLKHNADINQSSKDGSTALHMACKRNDIDLVKFLLESESNTESVDSQGRSAPFCNNTSTNFVFSVSHAKINGAK
jgi:ankyrin repeat protein